MPERTYIAIDLKSFYASVECVDRGLDPMTTNLVVADKSRTEKTICLAVSPALKSYGIPGRPRLFEVVQKVKEVNSLRQQKAPGRKLTGSSVQDGELKANPALAVDYVVAPPQMAHYMKCSAKIYDIYLNYIAPEDIHVYSIDEVFIDATAYLSHYEMSVHDLAKTMIREVLYATGITATAGIGPNLYLAKLAMDITAKHTKPDSDGVRIAELDEESFRYLLWDHQPLRDFWMIGSRTERKLAGYGIHTMGDIALASLSSEDLLFKIFGIDAELLIDHAWGCESCRMEDIKNYRAEGHSLSNGQVLMRNYSFEEGIVIAKEMTDVLSLDLVEKGLATSSVTLWIAYDHRFGREPTRGSAKFPDPTNSSKKLIGAVEQIYQETTDRHTGIRRVEIYAGKVFPETYCQYDLFSDPVEQDKEKRLQEAILRVKKRYGKNAIMRGTNLLKCSTYAERNNQIGGHKA